MADTPLDPETELDLTPPMGRRLPSTAYARHGKPLYAKVLAGEWAFGHLLKRMKEASGLTTRQIATKMGIQRDSLNQYLWGRVGKGGSSSIHWLLRYAEATGCKIWITFPSKYDQLALKVNKDDPKA